MTAVTWTRDLEIGIPFVDTDHKVLINLLNQVNACVDQNEESFILSSVLSALAEYTEYHFSREEKLLELCNYPRLDQHRAEHANLAQQVRQIQNDFAQDEGSVTALEVYEFLNAWLVKHIKGRDVSFSTLCVGDPQALRQADRIGFLADAPLTIPVGWDEVRIMLVDDNANFRRLIKTVLNAVGVKHLELIDNAEEALGRLSRHPADIVLCDWVMEGMNGAEFARKMEEMELPTRVVLLTGYSIDTLQERSTNLNITGYIEKPIQPRTFLEAIANALA